jgi:MFS family permease
MAAGAFVLSPVSGHLVGTRGVRLPLVTAGTCFAVAAAVLTQLSPTTPLPVLLGAYLVFGAGFGMVNSPITNTAVSGMPRAQAGVAAAVASTSRQVGQSLGVAISGSIAGAAAGIIGPGFAAATQPVWWLIVGCGAGIVVLALVATTARARASTERVASLFADDVPGPAAVPVPAA